MKRLAIFSFYDKQGIMDEYVMFFLSELKKVADDIWFVVNGSIREEDVSRLEELNPRIVIRENKGFDAGAYRDVIVNHIGKEKLSSFDEVILCNDTCYGPFVSFEKIWQEMDKKNCDFWGLNYYEMGFASFIHSYFMVFGGKTLKDDSLYSFFLNKILEDYSDVQEVIADFERGIFKYLVRQGYVYSTYIKVNNLDIYRFENVLLRDYGFPLMKKKCFQYPQEKETVCETLNWIKDATDYDINYIIENAKRLYNFKETIESVSNYNKQNQELLTIAKFKVSLDEFERFVNAVDDIYVYGCGNYGREVFYSVKESDKFKGFIVSDDRMNDIKEYLGYPIYRISEVKRDASIIVALSEKNRLEVEKYLAGYETLYIC